jgi:hypothetical protein
MKRQFNIIIDENLTKEFKKRCIDLGIEFNQGVERAIKEWLKI